MKYLLRATAVALPLLVGTAVLAQDDAKKKPLRGAKEMPAEFKDIATKPAANQHVNLRPGWNTLEPKIEGKQHEDYNRIYLSYKAKIDALEEKLDDLKEERTKALKAILKPAQLKQVEAFEAKVAKSRKAKAKAKDEDHDPKASSKHDDEPKAKAKYGDKDKEDEDAAPKKKKRIG